MVLKRPLGAMIYRRRGLSLRSILVVPFVLQLCLAVGVTNWLSWRNGQRAVHDLAFSLQEEVGYRVKLKLADYIETPVLVSRLNAEAARTGQVNLEDLEGIEDYLFRQLTQFDSVSGILVANTAGEMRAVNRRDGFNLLSADPQTRPKKVAEYALNDGGQPQALRQLIDKADVRLAPWYRSAVEAEGLVWSPIFQTGDRPDLSLNASLPVYGSSGQLEGVFSSGVVLSVISEFLHGLAISKNGSAFVVDQAGLLVASSNLDQPLYRSDLSSGTIQLQRVHAAQSSDRLIDRASEAISNQLGQAPLGEVQQLSLEAEGERHFISVIPFGDEFGMDWRIVVVMPEQDFTDQIRDNTRTTLALSGLALAGAIALGLATANWLARPIMDLSDASQAVARGDLAAKLDEQAPIREVATVARSFNQMILRLRRAFDGLETKVDRRTRQLQQSFDFEATLKRLTDRVRDSLDEDEILQRAVEELAIATGVRGCNAAIYDLDQHSSTVKYEYTTFPKHLQGGTLDMANFAGYEQLLAGQHFQHCGTIAVPSRGRVAMLACPMRDDQGVLGDLWLIKPAREAFNDQEIRLVQQVANQCAIAIRQARLYQAAQRQVTELARLNQLKDDFLSTVSHELRTPMANMKMALQMLEIGRQRQAKAAAALARTESGAAVTNTTAPDPSQRYFSILQESVQRESQLIENLLDLSRIDIQSAPPQLSTVEPRRWLRQSVQPYLDKTSDRLRWQLFLPDYLPLLQTDANYLQRILMELLDNACKYTPDNECITVSAQLEQGQISFSVGNSGVEIPVKERQRIFERFYRIPTSDPWKHGGTGLGLALVRQLSERLGGTVFVESSNHHTLFTVSFPLTISPQAQIALSNY